MVSSAFTHGEGVDVKGQAKGRFVQNFKRQSKQWGGVSVKLESATEFALAVEAGDNFLSFYIKAGYWHFYLHLSIRNFCTVHYYRNYYRCIALPFGWSASWFITFLKPFVHNIRGWGYRVLSYIEDFWWRLEWRGDRRGKIVRWHQERFWS